MGEEGMSGTLSVALCRVCAKESVMCAIVRGTGYAATGGTITDYVYAVVNTLPFPFFSHFYGTEKKRAPYTRAHKKEYIRAVPSKLVLGVIKGSVSYTWASFRAQKCQ